VTEHDLGGGYRLRIEAVYGDFRGVLYREGDLVARTPGILKSHTKVVRWGVRAKDDHLRSIAIAAHPHMRRSWRQRLFG